MDPSILTYVFNRGSKRVMIKEGDLHVEKIARIFQVNPPSLFITNEEKMAIFPTSNQFNMYDLTPRGHYEVHGDDLSQPDFPSGQADHQRFRFLRPSAAAGSPVQPPGPVAPRAMVKTYQRSVYMAELDNGRLRPSRTVVVRFTEFEATTDGIIGKVQLAMQTEDHFILTDAQCNEIVDSEGTRGSVYWKQNSRKIYAVPETVFQEFQQGMKRKSSKVGVTALQEIMDKIEEVVEAAQSLTDVTASINSLSQLARSHNCTVLILNNTAAEKIKEAFKCIICKEPMTDPMASSCCESLIGCQQCVEQCMQNPLDQCPKCRGGLFSSNVHRICGLNEALSALADVP